MKKSNLDRSGIVSKQQFIDFHNKLSKRLEEYYKSEGEEYAKALNEGSSRLKKIVSYFSWVYGKNTPPKNEKGQPLPTIEDLYSKSKKVQDFRNKCKDPQRSSPKYINFANQIYLMKSHFTTVNAPDTPHLIKGTENLYGIFLLVEDDIQDVKDLKEKGYWSDPNASQSQPKSDLPQPKSAPADIEWVHYVGMYFSIVSAKVKYFLFDISRIPASEDGKSYYVTEQGIRSFDLVKNEPVYEGIATKLSSDHYFASLFKPEADDLLNVIWKPDSNSSATCFRASFQGISKYKGRLLSLEATLYEISPDQRKKLVNNENEKAHVLDLCGEDIKEDIENLALYHAFQRRIIASRIGYVPREPNDNAVSPLQLKASGINIREFDFLPGTYRMLQFGFRRNNQISIIQSKFHIEQDGTAYLQTMVSPGGRLKTRVETLRCVLNPSNRPRNLKLCVTAYAKDTTNISNFAILDFDMDPPYTGIFSSVGFNARGVIGGYMAFDKDDSNFNPCKISTEELDGFIKDKKVKPIYDKLLEIWKDRAKRLPFDIGDDD